MHPTARAQGGEALDHSFTYRVPAIGKLFAHLNELRADAVERAYAPVRQATLLPSTASPAFGIGVKPSS